MYIIKTVRLIISRVIESAVYHTNYRVNTLWLISLGSELYLREFETDVSARQFLVRILNVSIMYSVVSIVVSLESKVVSVLFIVYGGRAEK